MKWLSNCVLSLLLVWPVISWAQSSDQGQQSPPQYQDVDDGQLLKLASYVLTPLGMALEWGVARPLHYLATQTAAAPVVVRQTER
jgi:hypothetical protein